MAILTPQTTISFPLITAATLVTYGASAGIADMPAVDFVLLDKQDKFMVYTNPNDPSGVSVAVKQRVKQYASKKKGLATSFSLLIPRKDAFGAPLQPIRVSGGGADIPDDATANELAMARAWFTRFTAANDTALRGMFGQRIV